MPRKRVERIDINAGWCKSCGICIEFCPKDVIDWDENGRAYPFRPERCIACELCERMCPDLAVNLVYGEPAGAATTPGSAGTAAPAAPAAPAVPATPAEVRGE